MCVQVYIHICVHICICICTWREREGLELSDESDVDDLHKGKKKRFGAKHGESMVKCTIKSTCQSTC
jgi:hypothetical protein